MQTEKRKIKWLVICILTISFISLSGWIGLRVYNKHELAKCYYEDLLNNAHSFTYLLNGKTSSSDKDAIIKLILDRFKDIEGQMRRDGFSSLTIKKLQKAADEEGTKRLEKELTEQRSPKERK